MSIKKIILCLVGILLTVSPAHAIVQTGIASYYWQPQAVACGGRFNPHAMTAAHKTLPCGSVVEVTGRNGRTVTVTINDRGPFIRGRIIDLSLAAAKKLGMTKSGLTKVTIRRVK